MKNARIFIAVPLPKTKRGRPQVPFAEASNVTKKRRLKGLHEGRTSKELIFAAKMALSREQQRSTVKLLTECTENSPERPRKLREIIKKGQTQTLIPYTANEALAYILNSDISRDVYIQTRLGAKRRNADIYPPYEKIKQAKQLCYPEGMEVTGAGLYTNSGFFRFKIINNIFFYCYRGYNSTSVVTR